MSDQRRLVRELWDQAVDDGYESTIPIDDDAIAAARRGAWSVSLAGDRPVPRDWFPADLAGVEILCLAAGGGQQSPILAAAGARVTLLDLSSRQLAHDRALAERHGLAIEILEGDMADLSRFPDERFELVFNPCSNHYLADVRVLWREAHRVLRPGGSLLAGYFNPVIYLFDRDLLHEGTLRVTGALPYRGELDYGHTFEDLLGGQIDAGFVLTGYYDDVWPSLPLNRNLPPLMVTRALKPGEVSSRA